MGLDSTVFVLEEYGPVPPSLQVAPIHFPEVRTTDGLGIEEGTTNLVLNPRAVGLSNWVTAGNGTLSGPDAFGIVTITATAAGNVGALINTAPGINGSNTLSIFTDSTRTFRLDYGASTVDVPSGARRVATINDTAGSRLGVSVLGVAAGEKVRLWMPQVEFKPYATSYCDGMIGPGYFWSSTPNASSSGRQPARVLHPTPPVSGPLTVCCFVKAGLIRSGDVYLATFASGAALALNSNGAGFTFTSGVDVAGIVNLSRTPGDLLFVAGTLDATGKIYTVYASKNGGALVSATSGPSGSTFASSSTLDVGSVSGSLQSNSGIEQLLIYNRVLSAAELAAIALPDPATGLPRTVRYHDDPSIVYAAATPRVRGTTSALTAAGTGLFRETRSLPANLDVLADFQTTYGFGGSATHRISVPAGSGIGPGTSLWFSRDGARYRVVNVFSPGGQFDECYAVQTA